MTTGKQILLYSSLSILLFYFLFSGISGARGILAPISTAVILMLVVLPVSNKLEGSGMKRSYSSLLTTFFLFLLSLGLLALLSFQVQSFIDDWPKVKEAMEPKVEQLQNFVFEHSNLNENDLPAAAENNLFSFQSSPTQAAKRAVAFFSRTIGFIGTYLLTLIYIFFLLNYRRHFKEFLLRLFPKEERSEVKRVVYKSAVITQDYLVGKLILMALLAVVYSIGLGISGVNNFILVSIIAALFTLIPYIGNIIGLVLAMAFGYLTSGELSVLVGVIITFSVAQFVESYVLQPYIVGDKVDLHPFFVIVGVVVGGALWGIIGMILAIPVLAIITIVLMHIPPLNPFGFLFSKKTPEE